jgi:WD40 repeat protein
MNRDDRKIENDPTDEVFESLVVAYSEALVSGVTVSAPADTALPTELLPRLRSTQACLSLLEKARRARQADSQGALGQVRAAADLASALHLPGANDRIGRFEIVRELGRGGYGVVFLAFDPVLNRQVALKVPRPEVIVTPELSRRFLREAQAAGSVAHPNLVAVYEVGTAGLFCFIASAYCNGPNLAQWLKSRTEPVPVRQAAALVAAIADGVDEAHQSGVLHRDIKPSNVLLETAGDESVADVTMRRNAAEVIPKLTDFGLAKLLEYQQDETRSNALLGTPAYMSPEQASGKVNQISPATDIYGLGAILYELLTGMAPFRGESDVQVLRRIAEDDAVNPRLLRPAVPRDLEAICRKCLEKQPANRYSSASALAADLRRFLAGEPTRARPISATQRASKWVRRRPALAGLFAVSAAALLSLAVLATAYIWNLREAKQTADALRAEAEGIAQTSTKHEQSANQLLYASRMRLAYQWLDQGDVERVASLLEPYDPSGPLGHLRGFEWFHLKRRLHGARIMLGGHSGQVYAATFSPGGRNLATGAQDGTIKLWDPISGRELTTIVAHASCVNSLAYSADGAMLASGSCDHKIKLWNASTHELHQTLEGHTDVVHGVAFSPTASNLLASCGSAPSVNIWDISVPKVFRRFDTPHRVVSSLAWRFDGRALLFAANGVGKESQGPAMFEWDISEEDAVAKYSYGAWAVAASTQSTDFYLGSNDGLLRMFNADSSQPLDLPAHTGGLHSLSFSPDGKYAASGGDDCTIRIWDTTHKRRTQVLTGHTGRIQTLAFSPDSRMLASGSFDGTVGLWDMQNQDHEVLTTDLFAGTQRFEGAVAISADFRYLAVQHRSNAIRILNVDDGSVRSDLTMAGTSPGIHFLGDRSCLLVSGPDAQTVDEWDLEQNKTLKTYPLGTAALTGLARCADGNTLAVADRAGVELIDTATNQTFRKLKKHEPDADQMAKPPHFCFSPNGKDVAISMDDLPSWIVKSDGKLPVQESLPEIRAITNGAEILAVRNHSDLLIALVDGHSQRQLATLRHAAAVNHVAFSPDGNTLATACADGVVYLWNVRTGEEITRFETRAGVGIKVQFSANGRRLAAIFRADEIALSSAQTWTAHLYIWNAIGRE